MNLPILSIRSMARLFLSKRNFKGESDIVRYNLKAKVKKLEITTADSEEKLEDPNVQKEIWLFNLEGNLVEQHFNTEVVLYKIFEYNSNNHLDTIGAFKEEEEILYRENYIYNKNGRLLSSYVNYYANSNSNSHSTSYYFDISGYLTKTKKVFENNVEITESREYDMKGRIINYKLYNYENLDKVIEYKYKKVLDTLVIEIIVRFNDGTIATKDTEVYSKEGFIVKKIANTLYGKVDTTYVYKFDKNGNWTSRTTYLSGFLSKFEKAELEYY